MKKLLSLLSIALIAIVLGSVILLSTGGEPRAAEIKPVEWDGDPSHVNLRAFLCDQEKMEKLLEDEENTRICVVNAVTNNDSARKMIIQKMLKNDSIRGMIMDSIASVPALRTQMEAKLAAKK